MRSFTYKGKAVKVQDIGREMGVRYVLRLWRYVFHFDPETMTVGHVPEHELPLGGGTLSGGQ